MPHIVLDGGISIESIFAELKPIFIRNGNTILRTMDLYLERDKKAILIDSVAIEPEKKTSFLAMITGRPNGVLIRLYPKVEVEKTEGVRRILAEIAKQLMQIFPNLKVGETNLSAYLD